VTLLNPETGDDLAETYSSYEGTYEFTHLPAGTYEVEVDPTCGAMTDSDYGPSRSRHLASPASQTEVDNATLPVGVVDTVDHDERPRRLRRKGANTRQP